MKVPWPAAPAVLYSEHVLWPDGGVRPASLVHEDGRIVAFEPRAVAGAAVLENTLVTPGWVDAHTHLALHALRGVASAATLAGNVVEDVFFRVERHLLPGDVLAFARMGAWEALLGGTTLVFDHYYQAPEVAAAVEEVGLDAVLADTLQDQGGPLPGETELRLARVKSLDGEGRWGAFGPHASDTTSSGLLAAVAARAQAEGRWVHLHLAQSADEIRRVRAEGFAGPVAKLAAAGLLAVGARLLVVHGLYLSREERAALRRAGATLVFCPSSQAQFGFPAPVGQWQDEGQRVALGTDAAASNDGLVLRAELRALAAHRAHALSFSPALLADRIDPYQIEGLRPPFPDPAVLLAAALDLGRPFAQGALEVGRAANLCLYDLDHPAWWPCRHLTRTLCLGVVEASLKAVVRRGRWIDPNERARPGPIRDSWKTHRLEADRRLSALLGRSGALDGPPPAG